MKGANLLSHSSKKHHKKSKKKQQVALVPRSVDGKTESRPYIVQKADTLFEKLLGSQSHWL